MHFVCSWLLVSGFTTVVTATTFSQDFNSQHAFSLSDAPVLNPRLDDAILDILKEFKTPGGIGVAVVHKTAEGTWKLESKGYGNATHDGDKVDADTLFAIGSNSKLFNVLATGLLISNETLTPRISWSSKMASILPDWKLMDSVATNESTIVDLMSHRTGLPRHDFLGPLDVSPADVILLLQHLRPSTGFREQLQYNNHMYTTLSHLPPALLNTTYERYVHDNIIAPLGMDATTFFYAEAVKTGRLAEGFLRQDANLTEDPFGQGTVRVLPFWDQSTKGHVAFGDGGVISSAHDMAIWLQMLLEEGKSQSNETVIPAEVIRKAATGVMVYTPVAAFPELSPMVYGGGQMRGTYRGFELIEHGGAIPGFFSQITRFPGQNLGIAVMTNDEGLGHLIMESVKYRIVDEVLQLDAIDWTARYRQQVAAEIPPPVLSRPKNADPPSVSYAALAGTYTNPAYGSLDLCLFAENTSPNTTCSSLSEEVAKHLSSVIEPGVPTFISPWTNIVTTHMQLSHFSGNVFNLTGLVNYPSEVPEQSWVRKIPLSAVEFEVDGEDIGFATLGIWGPGAGVPPPEGNTVKERAEIWFTKS
ncbi:beta-lactamase/transpeptidase-like protein [Mycena capillaripes]|nr:beta-lactamase/transpeptidase-like protein [Mycena capillaripes]